jgi:hypothetical protein
VRSSALILSSALIALSGCYSTGREIPWFDSPLTTTHSPPPAAPRPILESVIRPHEPQPLRIAAADERCPSCGVPRSRHQSGHFGELSGVGSASVTVRSAAPTPAAPAPRPVPAGPAIGASPAKAGSNFKNSASKL